MPLDFPPFRPHPLFRGGHMQTLGGCYLPWKRVPYQARQRLVPLADGDKIVLHDDCPAGWQPGDPAALLAHGLGGCHLSGYMQRCTAKLNERGMRVFRMDLRGCGAGFLHAKYPIHAGRSDDALVSLRYIIDLCPDSPVHVAGFSMGANIVLKMAGELAAAAPPELASLIAVGPPIDLVECSQNMQRGTNRFYDQSFVIGLMRHIERRQKAIPGAQTRAFATRPRRLVEFDSQFTAPLAGFADAHDYYYQSSAVRVLKRIAVPTLILAAASDPIIPVGSFEKASYSPSTELVIAPCGGHLGFVGRRGHDADRRWLDWRVVEWIAAHAPQQRVPQPHLRPSLVGTTAG